MKYSVSIVCIIVGLIGAISCASTNTPRTTPNTPRTTPYTPPRTTQRTSPAPRYSYCYTCQNCPLPFTSNSASVTRTLSLDGWCAKMAVSELPDARANRGIGLGSCYSRGCSWRTVQGRRTYLCCCHGNLCNSSLPAAKSSIIILFLSFLMVIFTKKLSF